MPARTSSRMTYRAVCPVNYHYTCERCGVQTESFQTELEMFDTHKHKSKGRFVVSMEVDIDGLEKTRDKALKRLRRARSALKKYLANTEENIPNTELVAEIYNELFAKGKSCPGCGYKQSWYPGGKVPPSGGPAVKWGKSSVDLLDMPEAEGEFEDTPPPELKSRSVFKYGMSDVESLSYWHMIGKEHINILTIRDINKHNLGVQTVAGYDILYDDFTGVTLSHKLNIEVSERDFQDIVLQLCDALSFLHSQDPAIIHNAVYPDNILIGKGNHLKLTGFDRVTIGEEPTVDIGMVGGVMKRFRSNNAYIARYQSVIDNCEDKYQTIDELRGDFLTLCRSRYIRVLVICFFIIAAIAFFYRRVM